MDPLEIPRKNRRKVLCLLLSPGFPGTLANPRFGEFFPPLFFFVVFLSLVLLAYLDAALL